MAKILGHEKTLEGFDVLIRTPAGKRFIFVRNLKNLQEKIDAIVEEARAAERTVEEDRDRRRRKERPKQRLIVVREDDTRGEVTLEEDATEEEIQQAIANIRAEQTARER